MDVRIQFGRNGRTTISNRRTTISIGRTTNGDGDDFGAGHLGEVTTG